MQKKYSTDHLGNEFSSQHEMCEYWGVAESLFLYRISHGYSKEEALTLFNGRSTEIDHEGNKFETVESMCLHYGVGRDTYEYRIAHGWTKKDALTTPVENKRISTKNRCVGPNGIMYASMSALCVAYGVSRSLVAYRMRKGQSLKEALTL